MSPFILNILSITYLTTLALALWPEPVQFSSGTTVLRISPQVELVVCALNTSCKNFPAPTYKDLHGILTSTNIPVTGLTSGHAMSSGLICEPEILKAAFRRTINTILSTKFVPWKFHSRNSEFEPHGKGPGQVISSVHIKQDYASRDTGISAGDFFNGDESYTLNASESGDFEITSKSTLGVIRAFQTMEQLFYAHSVDGKAYTPLAPILVVDSPMWPHRGLNIDISRNAFTPADVKRTIDAMATCKMSRLHVHATDAQSWSIDVPSLPTLAERGAYRKQLTWSSRDLRDVQYHGLERGVSVFLEIDLPGHAGSIAHSFPDLIAAFNETDWSTFALQPPSGSLKLNSPAVYEFLNVLFADIIPRVSPYTTLFHNGGDEVVKNAYLLDDTVMSNSPTVLWPLIQRLMTHLTGMVQEGGLTPVVWEEMLLDWNLTFSSARKGDTVLPDVIIQVWRSTEGLQKVLEKGYRAIFGDYHHWYLDCGYGGFLNPYAAGHSPPGVPYNSSGGAPTITKYPFLDYCTPVKNWRNVYSYNPVANVTEEVRHLIMGGEVHSWSEQLDPVSLDSRVWPRAAAAAEVLWSGPRSVRSIEDASRRLGEWRERAVLDHSIQAAMVQMTWCLMEGGCNW